MHSTTWGAAKLSVHSNTSTFAANTNYQYTKKNLKIQATTASYSYKGQRTHGSRPQGPWPHSQGLWALGELSRPTSPHARASGVPAGAPPLSSPSAPRAQPSVSLGIPGVPHTWSQHFLLRLAVPHCTHTATATPLPPSHTWIVLSSSSRRLRWFF